MNILFTKEQIKYSREENSSNNLIIRILSENAFNGRLPQQSKSYEAYYDFNVPFLYRHKQEGKMPWKEKHTAQFFYH